MPVYEFYCSDCHRVFNFLAGSASTEKRPRCPKCGKPDLTRQVSRFAVSKRRAEGEGDEGPVPDLNESQMEKAMAALAGEAEGLDEEDPRQAARLMRRLYDATGLRMGGGMEEAMRRMEAGEDMDQIEQDLGDVLEEEDPFAIEKKGKGMEQGPGPQRPPSVDEDLYDLESFCE